ncbi:hypothetical protein F511_24668 [Dorcoceras hygrometricum]|uniref:Uncharacterized protein n=1 Tax=Dorcoceras hygrometricum TaxID=472368 RepID=A0A2Z7DE71_9LAMI|nr:hypothetical protein F511_24668 [Dorcoceras hygrometricum]
MAEESHSHMNSPSVEEESQRTKIIPCGVKFQPYSHKVSAFITKKFVELQCLQGHTWELVDEETRNYYWEKFEEKYCWDPELDAEVRKTWNVLVADQYKKTLHNWRRKPQPPRGVQSEVWEHWQTIWSTPEWKHKSKCGKKNRYSEPAGPGTGISKHIGGSRSYMEHAIQLSADLKRKSTCWDLLKKTHGKEDGTFVDARSHAINEMMNVRYAEASQPTNEDGVPQIPTADAMDNIYLDVAGGVRKKRLYGIGSQAYITFPDAMSGRSACTRSSATAAAATRAAAVEAAPATGEFAALSSRCEALERENVSLRQELDVLQQQFRHLKNIVQPPSSSSTPNSD